MYEAFERRAAGEERQVLEDADRAERLVVRRVLVHDARIADASLGACR